MSEFIVFQLVSRQGGPGLGDPFFFWLHSKSGLKSQSYGRLQSPNLNAAMGLGTSPHLKQIRQALHNYVMSV